MVIKLNISCQGKVAKTFPVFESAKQRYLKVIITEIGKDIFVVYFLSFFMVCVTGSLWNFFVHDFMLKQPHLISQLGLT